LSPQTSFWLWKLGQICISNFHLPLLDKARVIAKDVNLLSFSLSSSSSILDLDASTACANAIGTDKFILLECQAMVALSLHCLSQARLSYHRTLYFFSLPKSLFYNHPFFSCLNTAHVLFNHKCCRSFTFLARRRFFVSATFNSPSIDTLSPFWIICG